MHFLQLSISSFHLGGTAKSLVNSYDKSYEASFVSLFSPSRYETILRDVRDVISTGTLQE